MGFQRLVKQFSMVGDTKMKEFVDDNELSEIRRLTQ